MDKKGKKTFEDALNQLESIVARLEDGDLPLEESLKLFEEGIRLSRFCNQKLNETQKKVEILLGGDEGKLEPQPFEPEDTTGKE
jgi:exodeoxyribonuclease VII small subunit